MNTHSLSSLFFFVRLELVCLSLAVRRFGFALLFVLRPSCSSSCSPFGVVFGVVFLVRLFGSSFVVVFVVF